MTIAKSEGDTSIALEPRIVPYNSNVNILDMRAKVISITIRHDLVDKIDAKRGDVPRSRWIVRALENRLQDLK